jgi:hypothetical protein
MQLLLVEEVKGAIAVEEWREGMDKILYLMA